MARPRKPLAINKKHFTQDERDQREAEEMKVPFVDVKPPENLTTQKQKNEFNSIAAKLVALNIFTELDEDALARYIHAKELYNTYTKKLKKMLAADEVEWWEVKTVQQLQDKAYRQCVTSANELCLNVSSRAKLVIPQPPENEPDEL